MTPIEAMTVRLAQLGIQARLEVRDQQLLVVPLHEDPELADSARRLAVIEMARDAGFSHVSLEIPGDEEVRNFGATCRPDGS